MTGDHHPCIASSELRQVGLCVMVSLKRASFRRRLEKFTRNSEKNAWTIPVTGKFVSLFIV